MRIEDKHIDYYIELIGKYLNWEASKEEILKLEEWVILNPENKAIFSQYKRTWILSSIPQLKTKIDIDARWNKLQSKINKEVSRTIDLPKKKNRWLYSIAASILMIFSVGLLYYVVQFSTKEIISREETLAIYLPDSSEVTLNRNSKLEYSKKFNKDERRVLLLGDAFFEIEPNPQKVFVVETQGLEIRVLGTAFYVDSRNDKNEIVIIVDHGKVSITSQTGIELILKKGEKAIFDKKNQELTKEKNSSLNFLAWKHKILIFNSTKLVQVIQAINKAYHTQIIIKDDSVKELQLTATYKHKRLKSLLKLLSETLDLKIIKNNNRIEIEAY